MSKRIRAVFFDLDGSTLHSNLVFSETFLSLSRRYPDISWVITTGRGMWSVKVLRLNEYFDSPIPHIFDNGAAICHFNGLPVRKHLLRTETRHDILTLLSELPFIGCIYASVFPDSGLVWSSYDRLSVCSPDLFHYHDFKSFADDVMKMEITKISVKSSLPVDFPSNLNIMQNKNSFDVIDLGVSKGSGINTVRKLLKLNPQDIAFVCDDLNDLSAINHPSLKGMVIATVGKTLINVNAKINVEAIEDVARHIERMLVSHCGNKIAVGLLDKN